MLCAPRPGWRIAVIACLAVLLQVMAPTSVHAGPAEESVALIERALKLAKEGKIDEAIAVQQRMIPTLEKWAGRRNPLYPTQIALLGDLHLMKGDYAGAERYTMEALRLREELLGREHADVAASHARLADIYMATAQYEKAESALQRAIAIRRKVLPESSPDYGMTYLALGRLSQVRSRLADAEHHFRQALALFERHLPPDHPYIALAQNNLADAARTLGNYAEAERLLRAALAANEKLQGRDSHMIAPNLNNLAELYRELGRYGEAEQLQRRAISIIEKSLGPDHPNIATNLNNLGLYMSMRGRPAEAVAMLRRTLAIQKKTFGDQHPLVATALHNLAEAVAGSGKPEEAELIYREALAMRERLDGPKGASVASSLHSMATFLHNQDRFAEAEPLARRSLEIRVATLPADHPILANATTVLAVILDELGRKDEARRLHEQALAIDRKSLGASHPSTAIAAGNLAAAQADAGDWKAAYAGFKESNRIWTERRAAFLAEGPTPMQSDADSELRHNTSAFRGQIRAAYELSLKAAPEERGRLMEESFAAHQWASLSSAAGAIAKMSARVAAGSGPLSALVREQQDLTGRLAALDKLLIAAMSSPAAARSAEGEKDIQQQADAARKRLAELGAELATRFPEFSAIASPQPVPLADIRRALRPTEALYTITATRYGSFAWLITPQTDRWVRIGRDSGQITDDVAVLRCGLDAAGWDEGGPCPKMTKAAFGEADIAAGKSPPFDLARAHALYRDLIAPVEDLIRGRELIVVPTGALTQLPFHVLVAGDAPPAVGAYAGADWFGRRNAITVLPAISSLIALRRPANASAASEPYLGFGNPLLDGPDERYASRAAEARAGERCGKPSRGPQVALLIDRAANLMTTGGLADVAFLRSQSPLPETTEELCAVAAALKAGDGAVRLGSAATEASIKRMNEQRGLARYRTLHFATHGTQAGEAIGVSEPGLLFTPPATASETDDGYLSASEIAALQLDADLVILSACNTAAGGAEDADTLAGLARSFFYAGARAMMVSHWAVNSEATVSLITTALSAAAKDKRTSYAEALRGAMTTLIGKGGASAHPQMWAPFVVVGVAPGAGQP